MLIPQELQLSPEKGKNTRLVKVWEGKASAFPSCFICTIQEIDAIHLWKK